MVEKIQQESSLLLNAPEGMLNVDSSEFVKKGKESVGVGRQYCGRLGKRENCQSGVFFGYSSLKGYCLIDKELYLPQPWFSDEKKKRWDEWGIPEDLTFKTKLEIAAEGIKEIVSTQRFEIKWIGADCTFGRDIDFLEGLAKGPYFFANVPKDSLFWLEKPEVAVPEYSGKGRKPSKEKVVDSQKPLAAEKIANLETIEWRKEKVFESSKGPVWAFMARLKVYVSRDGLPGKRYWLFIRRSVDGKETRYYLSNAPWDMPFEEMKKACIMRWKIEQCFQTAKSDLGMADYEHRSWIAWHRHMSRRFGISWHFSFYSSCKVSLKKTPFVTLRQVKLLIAASFNLRSLNQTTALEIVNYYMRQNHRAYLSHRKRVLRQMSL